jgi:hypothetical protein
MDVEFATRYTLKRSTFFTSDANVTKDKAVAYGMNPEKTIVFPWGVDLEHFKPNLKPSEPFNLYNFLQSRMGNPLRRGCAGAGIRQSGAATR